MSEWQLRAEIQRWRDLTQVLGSHRSCECQACRHLRDVADGMGDDDRDEQFDNYCKALEDTNLQLSQEKKELETENDGLLTLIFEQMAGGTHEQT